MSTDDLTEQLTTWAAEQTCGCGNVGLSFEWRYRSKPVGSFSLAGAQVKTSAQREPWVVCPSCGAEARGH